MPTDEEMGDISIIFNFVCCVLVAIQNTELRFITGLFTIRPIGYFLFDIVLAGVYIVDYLYYEVIRRRLLASAYMQACRYQPNAVEYFYTCSDHLPLPKQKNTDGFRCS